MYNMMFFVGLRICIETDFGEETIGGHNVSHYC